MTLQQRLTSDSIIVTLVGVLLASAALLFLAQRAQHDVVARSMQVIASLVSGRLPQGGISERALPSLSEAAPVEDVHLLIVEEGAIAFDSGGALEGERLAIADEAAISSGPAPIWRATVDSESFFLTLLPARMDDYPAGRLLVAVPVASLLTPWLSLLPATLLLAGASVGVAVLIGRRLSRQVMRPVETLIEAASRMAAGDYEARATEETELVEFRALSRTFNSVAEEVEYARRSQREFLAHISHDLRTPLTSIQGFSQALMDGAVPLEQTPRVSGIIHSEALHLGALIEELLELARIEAGHFSMVRRELALNPLLERCSERVRPQAANLGVEVTSDLPQRTLTVHGDADRLERVVSNLLDNAIAYASEGGHHVRLSAEMGGASRTHYHEGDRLVAPLAMAGSTGALEWIEIRVEDDGPAIPDDSRGHLFRQFYRIDPARRPGGSVAGLAIARHIVEAHGGDISIYPGEVHGTEFVVRLPGASR